ncbi:MAG: hypothetical protein ACRED1_13800, partial [Limisphaerales bacterium]
YRQIGIGSQWGFYQMLQDHFGLTREQAIWSYKIIGRGEKPRTLTLDGRISLNDVKNKDAKWKVQKWIETVAREIHLPDDTVKNVGNSKFYDVMLPVEQIFAAMFRDQGFDQVTIQTLRKRTSKKELYEYLVSGTRV